MADEQLRFLLKARFWLALLFLGCLSFCLPGRASKSLTAGKKLIEFGWDEPDPAFMRRHIAKMEATPFDGCVFHVDYREPNGRTGSFLWEGWGRRAITEESLRPALEDLKAIKFRRFQNNFLRFNTSPGDVDWFDDFSAVLNNARLAARFAKAGKIKGILFDIEQYQAPLFDYRRQRMAGSKSWQEYADQVRRRGREVMGAFQEGFPNLRIFLTFGYSLPWEQSLQGKKPLSEGGYGLLAPFLDGMVEGAQGRTQIIDGYEFAYGFKDTARFPLAYGSMSRQLLPIVADPRKYARVFSFSFGIWMDGSWRERGWNVNDVTRNFHSPQQFEDLVRKALEVADEYVWIYSETPKWWTEPDGLSKNLPEAYADALRRARGRVP